MLMNDFRVVRHYQRLTDSLVERWNQGYRFDELRLYVEGYIAALHQAQVLEAYEINNLEAEVIRYICDVSNFESLQPLPELER